MMNGYLRREHGEAVTALRGLGNMFDSTNGTVLGKSYLFKKKEPPIRVLLTACGSPGSSTMIRQLQKHGCYVIGVDMNPEAIGRWMCDEFYVVPPADDPDYVFEMQFVGINAHADVVLPQSSCEVPVLASYPLSFPILVSKPEPMAIATDKYRMYVRLAGIVDIPQFCLISDEEAFCPPASANSLLDLMWDWRAVVIKPPVGKGSRGVRIIDPAMSLRDQMLGKPDSKYATLSQVEEAFKDGFPEMLVMEKLEGEELAVDVLCLDGEVLLYTVRTVETQRAGVVMTGEIVDRPEIVEQVKAILKAIPLSYCVNLQFIGGKLIEINPRVSTFIYQDDVCIPYLAILLALDKITPDEVQSYQEKIEIGRRMVRYHDQIFWEG